jgi:sortase A
MDKLLAYIPEETRQPDETLTPEIPPITEDYVGPIEPPQEELRPMPEVVIDGVPYIGYLKIPALSLELPVLSESNEENLEIAPCRFFGTVYQKNFVIGGHRYRRHFRKLSTLGYGETFTFTDMDGIVYTYEVVEQEIVQPDQAEYLCSGDWDLSLYTCTPGGLTRVVLRCLRVPR